MKSGFNLVDEVSIIENHKPFAVVVYFLNIEDYSQPQLRYISEILILVYGEVPCIIFMQPSCNLPVYLCFIQLYL